MASLISIAELQPGMILGADLRAYNGRFLLPEDQCLSENHIRIMKMWGVVDVHIKNMVSEHPCSDGNAVASPADQELLQEQVRSRFCCVPLDHPAISALYRCAICRPAERVRLKIPRTAVNKFKADINRNGIASAEPSVGGIVFNDRFWNEITLPTLPRVLFNFNETITNPRSSAYEIAEVIGKDTGLTARLLKMANSAFYGFSNQIDSLQRAVTIIGAKQLTTLSYAMNIVDIFKDVPADCIDMASFWWHSVACGVCARILAGYKNIHNTERLFVAGLLHDIGRLLLYQYASVDMSKLLLKARSDRTPLHKLEYEALNLDHAILGGRLLKQWRLPAVLEDIVHFHHSPENATNGIEATILHVADVMINAIGIGSSGESLAPPLDLQAWERLGLSENTLTATLRLMDQQIKDVFIIFFPNEKAIKQYH
jgi:HD-like signal output (HDOD) protein